MAQNFNKLFTDKSNATTKEALKVVIPFPSGSTNQSYQIDLNLNLSDHVSDKLFLIQKNLSQIQTQTASLQSSLRSNSKETGSFVDNLLQTYGQIGSILSGMSAIGIEIPA